MHIIIYTWSILKYSVHVYREFEVQSTLSTTALRSNHNDIIIDLLCVNTI